MNQQARFRGIALAIAVAAIASMTACSKTEQGAQPAANAPATPASGLENKSKDDLARIRELMEKDEARKMAEAEKAKALGESMAKGARAPVNTFGR